MENEKLMNEIETFYKTKLINKYSREEILEHLIMFIVKDLNQTNELYKQYKNTNTHKLLEVFYKLIEMETKKKKNEIERQIKLLKKFCEKYKNNENFIIVFEYLEDTITSLDNGDIITKDNFGILWNYCIMYGIERKEYGKYKEFIRKFLKEV